MRMLKSKHTFRLFFLLIVPVVINAQESFDFTPFHPQIALSVTRVPERNFKTMKDTSYSSSGLNLSATVPVVGALSFDTAGATLYQLLMHAHLRNSRADLSFLPEPRRLISGSFGMTGIAVTRSKNFYILSASLGFSEDNSSINKAAMRLTFFGMGTYRTSDEFMLLYGANFSFIFARAALVPMAGCRWKISDDWSSSFVLPFSLRIRHTASSVASVGFSISTSGDRIRFANESLFAGEGNIVFFKIVQVRIGFDAGFKIGDALLLRGELGLLGARKVSFASGDRNFLTDTINPSGYLSIGLRYSLKGSRIEEE